MTTNLVKNPKYPDATKIPHQNVKDNDKIAADDTCEAAVTMSMSSGLNVTFGSLFN